MLSTITTGQYQPDLIILAHAIDSKHVSFAGLRHAIHVLDKCLYGFGIVVVVLDFVCCSYFFVLIA